MAKPQQKFQDIQFLIEAEGNHSAVLEQIVKTQDEKLRAETGLTIKDAKVSFLNTYTLSFPQGNEGTGPSLESALVSIGAGNYDGDVKVKVASTARVPYFAAEARYTSLDEGALRSGMERLVSELKTRYQDRVVQEPENVKYTVILLKNGGYSMNDVQDPRNIKKKHILAVGESGYSVDEALKFAKSQVPDKMHAAVVTSAVETYKIYGYEPQMNEAVIERSGARGLIAAGFAGAAAVVGATVLHKATSGGSTAGLQPAYALSTTKLA